MAYAIIVMWSDLVYELDGRLYAKVSVVHIKFTRKNPMKNLRVNHLSKISDFHLIISNL